MTQDANDQEPIYATISGVAVVTIPVEHYASLLEDRRKLAEFGLNNSQLIRPSRSMVQRDPEVAIFLANGLGLKPVPMLLKDCKKKFGKARTPSQQSIYRYWQAIRRR